jgi:Uma2 family endonuclease
VDNPEKVVRDLRARSEVYRWLSTDTPEHFQTGEELTNLDFMTATAGIHQTDIDGAMRETFGWTDEALAQVEDDLSYEIEDGHLTVSARPSLWHQEACARLKFDLEGQCPPDLWPAQEGEIRIYSGPLVKQLRAPDVMLVPRSLIDRDAVRGWVHPHEVPLAIEVVSPSSETADRVTKVGIYASWGIPIFLRLESRPQLALYEYRIGPNKRYGEPIEHREVFETRFPFPIRLDLARLA